MTVNWTQTAIAHLEAIHVQISLNSALYARRMVDWITRRSEQIGTMPCSGAIVPEYSSETVREVFEKPYRVIERITPDWIDVLAVVQGARQLPRGV